MRSGILNINKGPDMTSHDVVAIVRRALGTKKVGHTGTLDPMAEGVLPICIGKATRVIEYMDLDFKTYICKAKLGIATDTLDIWGKTISENMRNDITEEEVIEALNTFKGHISQVPPIYSALKVNGKRLYQYAREGKEVEIKSRNIYIKHISPLNIDLQNSEVEFIVECSKGTYIRSICRDIGKYLDCDATMSALTRTKSGIFDIKNAIDISKIKNMTSEEITKELIKPQMTLTHFGEIVVEDEVAAKLKQGWALPEYLCQFKKEPEYKEKDFFIDMRNEYKKAYCVYEKNGNFLSVVFYNEEKKKFVSDKVFYGGE